MQTLDLNYQLSTLTDNKIQQKCQCANKAGKSSSNDTSNTMRRQSIESNTPL